MNCKVGRFVKDGTGRMIQVHEAALQQQYECVHCGKRVGLRISKRGRPFFVHTQGRKTKQSHDFAHHLLIQRRIGAMLATSGIFYKYEHAFVQGLRADIYFLLKTASGQIRCVIEVQRTPLSDREIKRRTTAYKSRNVRLIWIIIKELHSSVHLQFWEQCIMCSAELLLFYDPKQEVYYYPSDYVKCSITRLVITYARYDIANIRFLKSKSVWLPFTQHTAIPGWQFRRALTDWRVRRMHYKQRDDALTRLLYELQLQEADIPMFVYTASVRFLAYHEAVFWLQTFIYLLYVKKGWRVAEIMVHCCALPHIDVVSARDDVMTYTSYLARKGLT
jgi:competence CoiA-like predicted nuclease